MSEKKTGGVDQKPAILNLGVAFVLGKVGCLTLIIIIAAIMAGMWLDQQFQTKSIFTFSLVVLSIPLSIAAMLGVVRSGLKRLLAQGPTEKIHKEEPGIGNSN